MQRNVLITGGAGFIGSHVCRRLSKDGWAVTILDNLSGQVHGRRGDISSDLEGAKFIRGDVRERAAWEAALAGQDIVVHLAAETGTGQSMYEVEKYSSTNILGTSLLLDYLANHTEHGIKKLIVASSRAVYGEGKYECTRCGPVYPRDREVADLQAGRFEPKCPFCSGEIRSVPTDEDSQLNPSSFYGLTKQVQEQAVLMFARSLKIPAFGLRFQNVYGPGQSLKNPYTGILAIFSNLARMDQTINIFEDGAESRDFVHVEDAVEAILQCISAPGFAVEALNVGSGERTTVLEVARQIVSYFKSRSKLEVSGDFRVGDIRHNFADLQRSRRVFGFEPRWRFRAGIETFLKWAEEEEVGAAGYLQSLLELKQRNLMFGSNQRDGAS